MLNTLHQIRWLVSVICICLLVSTLALCGFLLAAHAEIRSIAASLEGGQLDQTVQNQKASITREALIVTLNSLQREITEMAVRERALDEKLAHQKH